MISAVRSIFSVINSTVQQLHDQPQQICDDVRRNTALSVNLNLFLPSIMCNIQQEHCVCFEQLKTSRLVH